MKNINIYNIFTDMEKQILTEIRRIREMMNLSLLTEQKDELYNLLIKLGREGENEAEKIEIRNALKKQGFSDVEIRTIAAGGDNILDNAVRRLEQKVSIEGLGDLEGILIKQGISKDAIASLPDGDFFINGVQGLYTSKRTGLITDAEYQNKLNDVINALSDVANVEELKRAIKSIELDVDKQIDKKIVPETIPQNRPLTTEEIITNPELNSTLEQMVGTEVAKKARKEFAGMSETYLKNLYDEAKRGLIRDENLKIRVSETHKKNPSLWKSFNPWQKALASVTGGFGVLYALAYIKNTRWDQFIEDTKGIWEYVDELTLRGEEKEAIKTKEELSDYVQKVSNYGVYDKKDNKIFVVDLETFLGSEHTVENQLKDTVPNAIEGYYDLNKDNLNNAFIYEFMNKIATEKIQPLIDNVKELKDKFTVKGLEYNDPNRPKTVGRNLSDLVSQFRKKFDSKYKGTLKSNPEAEKRQKTSYEQPKQNNLPTNF
tara:strand:- start:1695 stop:3158 length:1464 start_codon:yes stop_codon:yes gene_type:complete